MAEPITLLDLDAAGLNPTIPAPPEFIQFLYDNSRSGYLTLWSSVLDQPGGAPMISRWINDGLALYYSRSLLTQMAPAGDKPAGEGVTEVTYSGPTAPPAPVCVDTPFVSGIGAVDQVLSSTMGNWGNEPATYSYAWSGSSGGTDPTYLVVAADVGTSITCVVSATNAGGTTASPPSNAIPISGATRAAEAAPPPPVEAPSTASRRDYPKEPDKDEPPHHRTTGSATPRR